MPSGTSRGVVPHPPLGAKEPNGANEHQQHRNPTRLILEDDHAAHHDEAQHQHYAGDDTVYPELLHGRIIRLF